MPLTDEQRAECRLRLERLREELRETAAAAGESAGVVELDQTRVGRLSRMDALQGQAMAAASQQRAVTQLRQVDAALARLESGEFGVCPSCGEDIDPRRLLLQPTVTLCLACTEARERA
jgi:DnaK suppressor protein